jgi:hypothetical protein
MCRLNCFQLVKEMERKTFPFGQGLTLPKSTVTQVPIGFNSGPMLLLVIHSGLIVIGKEIFPAVMKVARQLEILRYHIVRKCPGIIFCIILSVQLL